jgi:hypothetical protein
LKRKIIHNSITLVHLPVTSPKLLEWLQLDLLRPNCIQFDLLHFFYKFFILRCPNVYLCVNSARRRMTLILWKYCNSWGSQLFRCKSSIPRTYILDCASLSVFPRDNVNKKYKSHHISQLLSWQTCRNKQLNEHLATGVLVSSRLLTSNMTAFDYFFIKDGYL